MQLQFAHPSALDRRELDRNPVHLVAQTRTDRQVQNFTILDLSSTGCMVETDGDLRLGEKATVGFPGGYVETAEVVWCRPGKAGLVFVEPLSKAVLSSAKLKSDYALVGIVEHGRHRVVEVAVDRLADVPDSEKLPHYQRLRIILALASLPWLIGVAAALAF